MMPSASRSYFALTRRSSRRPIASRTTHQTAARATHQSHPLTRAPTARPAHRPRPAPPRPPPRAPPPGPQPRRDFAALAPPTLDGLVVAVHPNDVVPPERHVRAARPRQGVSRAPHDAREERRIDRVRAIPHAG